ncbi:SACOL1771 family peroxiredoxin [Rossellomorea aquimaris]|uniref:SACOL1771 family peroxiredoxin n=1 Tax=Rossellomorea aquimaris TaxID=189382 RepID=UPI001CD6D93F|nr:SACOL1771 family peroxiredoxin [Rossellomorea aquimaris]MCA1059434.1 SACOL1771 family peroxiredoxin [Rossellomorea aquimaris]
MVRHSFHISTDWPGLRNDSGTLSSENFHTKISIPPEMDGPGIGTNPDEMLLGAAATCYIITLAAMLQRSHIEKTGLSMTSEGIVEVDKGVITYKEIIHRPILTLGPATVEKDISLAKKLLVKAEKSCMITRAIKGNVSVKVDPEIHM